MVKLFTIVAIFVYTFLFSIIGAVLIAFSLRTESLDLIAGTLSYLSKVENIRAGMAATGLLLILVNISIAQLSLGKLRRHKAIAFENPYGQVTVSLSAIEDYIKKLTQKMAEIKEIRSTISAGKSGIDVAGRAVLYSDANIPEVTEKIQNAIRIRLQEILGIEETVRIKIHVAKIAHRKKEQENEGPPRQNEPTGFRGEIEYGR